MDISEVAKRTGLPASTLRFYEKKELISATRAAGGWRHFAPDVLDQLALIALGQAGGLSLDEIHAMLSPDGAVQVDRKMLSAKADEIDATIKRLRTMSQGLRHAAACPAAHHAQCPTFQRLLKAAAAGRLKPGAAAPKVVKRHAKSLQLS
ncbi:MerR family transcriptional regulator [Verticiella sediminum]|uniref:MerR family transcriptional regulator n=1 Tax=Verticiella sediminum TaxID=1247510 RepID=A0A556ACT2_9BURK|nr:MerR family transcriptional regulator [Verticiella sediminum]TSH90691.1 MerR family transcriptional regulator [Verticiella sediminum]